MAKLEKKLLAHALITLNIQKQKTCSADIQEPISPWKHQRALSVEFLAVHNVVSNEEGEASVRT